MSCSFLAEVISLCIRRFKQRKYVPSGVVREIDSSVVAPMPPHTPIIRPTPEPRVITSMHELEALFNEPKRKPETVE